MRCWHMLHPQGYVFLAPSMMSERTDDRRLERNIKTPSHVMLPVEFS